MLVRKGLPPLGYPKQSPEQERVRGIDTREVQTTWVDELVFNTVNSLHPKVKRIVNQYWLYDHSMAQIAIKEGLSKSGVKWRIDAVKEKIARECDL
jgi:DNA-directed RNA polymerase specialized sigma24 family protein